MGTEHRKRFIRTPPCCMCPSTRRTTIHVRLETMAEASFDGVLLVGVDFTGSSDEVGEGAGEGHNVNIPLPRDTTGDKEYCEALSLGIEHIRKSKAAYLVVSLGVDTYKDDPICCFQLTTPCYTDIGRLIGDLGLPTLFVLEGGYHLESLGENVRNVLVGFMR